MVKLVSGLNYIVVTLTELTTIEDAQYVMVLQNDSTAKKYALKLDPDLSNYPDRFNKFSVTVTSNPDPLSGQVYLFDAGSYHYYIYETVDADSFDYDNIPETITGEVEQGRLEFVTETVDKNYYKNSKEPLNTYV